MPPFWNSFTPAAFASPSLVSLDVAHIDPFSESVRVLGKGRKERVVPVGAPALEAIQKYRSQAGVAAGPLFISKRRRRISPSPWATC